MSKLTVFAKAAVTAPGKMQSNVFVEIDGGKVTKITCLKREADISADVLFPGFIDPHVHCRDANQGAKETIRTAGEAAARGGVTRVHDMPNTSPPILTETDALKRMETAGKSGTPVGYALYMGLTSKPSQIAEAVTCVRKYRDVAGLKLYAGESTGELAVTGREDQALVYRTLVKLRYRGVLMVHCEDVEKFRSWQWNPKNPRTWCDARPPEAEVFSVKAQLRLAAQFGFRGKLHVCHASLPETIGLLKDAAHAVHAGCGVTPHHVMLSRESMGSGKRGLLCKVNPPLRDRVSVEALRKELAAGRVRWIETDHAPHRQEEKLNPPHASGVPGLDTYANFVSFMIKNLRMTLPEIARLTSMEAARLFNLPPAEIKPGSIANLSLIDMQPQVVNGRDLRTRCGWSPYEGMTFPGRCRATIVGGEVVYDGKDARWEQVRAL
ncbi:MAG: dihydroorotase family protein [Candidatus Aenigmatarchaeota archaeon]